MEEPSKSRKRARNAASPKPTASMATSLSNMFTSASTTTTTVPSNFYHDQQQIQQQKMEPLLLVQSDQVRAAQQLRSPRKDQQRNAVLNDLLRVTSAHEKNYSLTGDAILKELVRIVVNDCIGWNEEDDDLVDLDDNNKTRTKKDSDHDPPVFSSKQCWMTPPTKRATAWAEHWKEKLGRNRFQTEEKKLQTLEVILVILRNFSFVGANLRLLAYSPSVIHLIVGCLYEGTENCEGTEEMSSVTTNTMLSFSAIQTLVHLAPYLDVSGQRLCSDRLFYKPPDASDNISDGPRVPDSHTFGQAVGDHWGFGGLWLAKRLDTKEDALNDVTKDFILSLSKEYLVAVWSIFPALTHVLTNPKPPRLVVLMALDLLQELINHARSASSTFVGSTQLQDDDNSDTIPSIQQILIHMPDAVLERLLDFLYVPRLGPDSLEYVDPVHNIVTRVTTLKLLAGYDATVDTDIRDRTLDVLVPLMELDSPRMARRILGCYSESTSSSSQNKAGKMFRTNKLLDSVLPILTTNVGRSEASMLALQLLRELVAAKPQSHVAFCYMQERLVELATSRGGDPRISSLIWNHLYAAPDDASENENHNGEENDDADDDENGVNQSMSASEGGDKSS